MDEEVDLTDEIAALLSEAAETHHLVYRITDGEDPDWASWYAKWLLELSELPDLLGAEPVLSHLVYELVRLDREYTAENPDEAWELYYARQLIEELGATDEDGEFDEEAEIDDEFDEDEEEIDLDAIEEEEEAPLPS